MRLQEKGVHLLLNSSVKEVRENTVVYECNGETKTLTGDTLIFAVGYASAPLQNDRIIQIGDSNKVGNLKDAISSAYQLAVTL